MKATKYFGMSLMLLSATMFVGCSEDDLSSTSIFDNAVTEQKSDFDQWLYDNYTKEYNIDFKYRYTDKESDLSYNVIPADYDKSKAIAKLVKHVWMEPYENIMGKDFLRSYAFKIIQLIGSFEYNANGSQVMGTAEKGLKIMLFDVNNLDIDNISVDVDNPYNKRMSPLNSNYYFFHTMHHEFCHILTQTKDYNTDFRTITAGSYHATDWVNVDDDGTSEQRDDWYKAQKQGFVSAYASQEYNEDFAEVYSTYVTTSEEGWQMILDRAGEDGAALIEQKLEMVKSYFSDSWGVDIDVMRANVLKASAEASTLDLRTLN